LGKRIREGVGCEIGLLSEKSESALREVLTIRWGNRWATRKEANMGIANKIWEGPCHYRGGENAGKCRDLRDLFRTCGVAASNLKGDRGTTRKNVYLKARKSFEAPPKGRRRSRRTTETLSFGLSGKTKSSKKGMPLEYERKKEGILF